jgi:CheY-like chemotaxis protein
MKNINVRLLIVEDIEPTLHQLRDLLSVEFPGVDIDTASTQNAAQKLIQKAGDRSLPYDVLLLDLKLPDREGDPPELNEKLFRQLRETGHESVVIHTTAYPDHPDLMKYILGETMRSPLGPRSVFLPTIDPSWPREVVNVVGQALGKRSKQPTSKFMSCFISYAHQDETFVKRLYTSLRANEVEVWFAPEAMKPGRKIHKEIEHAVRIYDKFLLVLSDHSMKSEWVATEIRTAIDHERENGIEKLIPIRLVGIEKIKKWKSFNSDTGKDMAVELREYLIPNFSNWRNPNKFEEALRKLLAGLKGPPK